MDGFAELTLECDQPEPLAEFYTEVFGMSRLSDAGDRIWLAAGPTARLGIWSPGAKEFGDRGGSHVHFAFSVAPGALDAISERARAAGAPCEGPLRHGGGDRSLYVTDPAGNRIEAWDLFARGGTVHQLSAGADRSGLGRAVPLHAVRDPDGSGPNRAD